jgi:hypothetical protein
MKWIDIELYGAGWITPHKVDHPDLGEIWIGGSAKKHIERTPPSRYMRNEAQRNADFALYCASQLPHVEIAELRVVPVTDQLVMIEAEIENDRDYPTSSDRAVALKRAVMDRITVATSAGIQTVELGKGPRFDPSNPAVQAEAIVKGGTEFRLKAHDRQRFCALVKLDGDGGWAEVKVVSKAGGTATKRVKVTRR